MVVVLGTVKMVFLLIVSTLRSTHQLASEWDE